MYIFYDHVYPITEPTVLYNISFNWDVHALTVEQMGDGVKFV